VGGTGEGEKVGVFPIWARKTCGILYRSPSTSPGKKSWASSPEAKSMQAHFLCLAHNLTLLQEHKLAVEHQITNIAETRRKTKRMERERKTVFDQGIALPTALQVLQRVTQRSIKFIRWLRIFLFSDAPWSRMLADLRRLYATPLAQF
jgi:hypothetical protein